MAPLAMASTATSGLSASGVNCHVYLIVDLSVYAYRRPCVAAATAIAAVAAVVVVVADDWF
jgi:hypothetical protein